MIDPNFCAPLAGPRARVLAGLRWAVCPFPEIESALPQEGQILDVGSGYGFFSRYLARRAPKRQVVGIDISRERVRLARLWHSGVVGLKFTAVDAAVWSPPPADGIVMIDLLHHMNPEARLHLLNSCSASLKPGGVLVIKEIGRRPLWKYGWNWLHDLAATRGGTLCFLDEGELPTLARQAGFVLEPRPLAPRFCPYPHELWVGRPQINS